MLKKISAMKARQNLGQIMNEVSLKEDEYIVERAGKPLIAIIPIETYLKMKKEQEEAKERFFRFVEETRERTKDIDPKILEQEIEEAVQAVKKQELEEVKSKA